MTRKMGISVHKKFYMDKIERTNKLQTLVAIANASLNIKNKEEVITQLEYALNIFKKSKSSQELGAGTYKGSPKQFHSKYTLGRDFGLIRKSRDEIILSELGLKLAKGEISAKYFISVIMLNYIQIIDNKVVNILYSILREMKSNNYEEITKKQLISIKDLNLNGADKDGYINGLFDILRDTYFFEEKDKNTLKIYKTLFDINSLISITNIDMLNIDVSKVQERYSDQEEWCSYLNQENNEFLIILLRKFISNKNSKSVCIKKSWNRIIFGAPGTGKSYKLNKDIEENQLKDSFERVTFHPNYTFSQFVGSYKPVSRIKEGSDEKEIRYEFVPGPFLRVLVDSLNDESNGTPHVLIIEEINRANPAVVFGDVFQLLDRDETGKSVYSINISEEIKEYLESQQISIQQLYIPSNMYIWATMNSADQGVYPMDSAFKRRWSFEYIDIDENQENIAEKKIKLKSSKDDYKTYRWNELRIEINKVLKKAKVNEDKLLGPFFLSKTELSKTGEEFDNIFKSKVLMYLYEDILKHKKIDLFVKEIKVSDEEILQVNTLSDIMKAYDNGKVFNFSIKEIDNTILNTNKNNLINYNNKEETVVNNEYEYEEGKENFDKVAEEQASFNLE